MNLIKFRRKIYNLYSSLHTFMHSSCIGRSYYNLQYDTSTNSYEDCPQTIGGGGGGGGDGGDEEGPTSSLCGVTTLLPRLNKRRKLAEALAIGDITLAGLLTPPLGISIVTSNGARMADPELLVSFSFEPSCGFTLSGTGGFSGSGARVRLLCRCLEARMAAMKGAPMGSEGLVASAATPVRHKGQVECEWSHMSMHSR